MRLIESNIELTEVTNFEFYSRDENKVSLTDPLSLSEVPVCHGAVIKSSDGSYTLQKPVTEYEMYVESNHKVNVTNLLNNGIHNYQVKLVDNSFDTSTLMTNDFNEKYKLCELISTKYNTYLKIFIPASKSVNYILLTKDNDANQKIVLTTQESGSESNIVSYEELIPVDGTNSPTWNDIIDNTYKTSNSASYYVDERSYDRVVTLLLTPTDNSYHNKAEVTTHKSKQNGHANQFSYTWFDMTPVNYEPSPYDRYESSIYKELYKTRKFNGIKYKHGGKILPKIMINYMTGLVNGDVNDGIINLEDGSSQFLGFKYEKPINKDIILSVSGDNDEGINIGPYNYDSILLVNDVDSHSNIIITTESDIVELKNMQYKFNKKYPTDYCLYELKAGTELNIKILNDKLIDEKPIINKIILRDILNAGTTETDNPKRR